MIFFDTTGAEVARADSQLRSFNMLGMFDYVYQKKYKTGQGFQRYLANKSERLRSQGIDVDIWKY